MAGTSSGGGILADLTKQLEASKLLIERMKAELERLGEAGLELATVIEIDGKYAVLSNGLYANDMGLKVGGSVLCYPKTGQVVEVIKTPMYGALVQVEKVTPQGVEVHVDNARKVIAHGGHTVHEGDTVLLDRNNAVVLKLWEHAKKKVEKVTKVHWGDIGGNDEAKLILREAIELPYLYPDLFKGYGKGQCHGVLLYGEPGNGKTMLGKAVATSIGSEGGFFSINGPEVLNEYVGVSERAIRSVFERAKHHKVNTGKPGIVWIDEAEALLTKRGAHGNYMGQTIVPQFLSMMDGLEESSAIVMLSTNRRDMLDPAVIREGRIDHQVEVKPPEREAGAQIFDIYLSKKPLMKGRTKEQLVAYATTTLYGTRLKPSGAMIAGCVDKAVTHALRRDLDKYAKHPSGLCEGDFSRAVDDLVTNQI